MKLLKALCCIFLFISLTAARCNKDKDPVNQLPPETQEGKGTFGCLVNGQGFEPKGSVLSSPILSCTYQFLNTSTSHGYFFGITAIKNDGGCLVKSISIATDSLKITESSTYNLTEKSNGSANAQYLNFPGCGIFTEYTTNKIVNGQMSITKYDSVNQIIAGRFWFNAVNSDSDTIRVTEGRFDVKYAR